MRPEHWRDRGKRCDRERAAYVAALVSALRHALDDRGPGYFSFRELHNLYAGPPIAVAARLCQIAPALVAVRLGDGYSIVYWRPYRERAAGVEVTR